MGVVIEDDGLTDEEFKSDLKDIKKAYKKLSDESNQASDELDKIFNELIGE